MINPYRAKDKREGLLNFNNELINYNSELNEFKVSGLAPDYIKEVVRIPHFVIDYLEKEKGIYLFESKKQ